MAPYGVDNYRSSLGPSEFFVRNGYIFAYCDVRGRGKSEGTFEHVRPYIPDKAGNSQVDEASDTYDTIDFLLKTIPNHNGRVGISGSSYAGFYATMAALSGHPALKAVSPQAPVTEWFIGDDWRHNGALFLAHAFRFLFWFRTPTARRKRSAWPPLRLSPLRTATISSCAWGRWAMPTRSFSKARSNGGEISSRTTPTRTYWKARDPLPYLKNITGRRDDGGWLVRR